MAKVHNVKTRLGGMSGKMTSSCEVPLLWFYLCRFRARKAFQFRLGVTV